MNFTDFDLNKWNQIHDLDDLTEDEKHKVELICHISKQISDVYLWLLFVIGFPANVFTIITILTMQAMSPATFFVALLAAFDGTALLTKLIFQQLEHYKIAIGDFGCKTENITSYLATVANWMLALICAERFVSVCYPLQKVSLLTKRRSYICATVISLVILLVYGSISVTMRVSVGYVCTTHPRYSFFWTKIWFWLNATFFLFLPLLLVLFFTVAIVRGLYISRRDRRSLLDRGSSKDGGGESAVRNNERLLAESERIERAITIMMVLAAGLFITLALPACLYYLIGDPGGIIGNCHKNSIYAHWDLFQQIQYLLVDATHAINFFIYFLTVRRFRDQFFKLVRCKFRNKKRRYNNHQLTYTSQLSSSSKTNLTLITDTQIR